MVGGQKLFSIEIHLLDKKLKGGWGWDVGCILTTKSVLSHTGKYTLHQILPAL